VQRRILHRKLRRRSGRSERLPTVPALPLAYQIDEATHEVVITLPQGAGQMRVPYCASGNTLTVRLPQEAFRLLDPFYFLPDLTVSLTRVAGTCVGHGDCAPGQVCNGDGTCEAEVPGPCVGDDDCQNGTICIDGICRPPVEACVPACVEGEECRNGLCVARPVCEPACGAGQACVGGQCQAAPCVPACAAGQACVGGQCQAAPCVPACAAGQVCNAGVCEAPAGATCADVVHCGFANCQPGDPVCPNGCLARGGPVAAQAASALMSCITMRCPGVFDPAQLFACGAGTCPAETAACPGIVPPMFPGQCANNFQCPDPLVCNGGACGAVPVCAQATEVADCGAGRICQSNACVDGQRCDANNLCGPGSACVNNLCVAGGCAIDADCPQPDGERRICLGRQCQAGCRVDGDCAGGARCIEFTCFLP
jgi:hypothetical protein